MRPDRPRSIDSAFQLQFLQAFAWLGFGVGSILLAVEATFFNPGSLLGWAGFILLDLVLLAILALGLGALTTRAARGLVNLAFAAGDLPSAPEHSALESLVARGFYPEARDGYRAWLQDHPGDHLARLKLAALCQRHLGQPDEAERLYQEVIRGPAPPREAMLASNLLIELYRSLGRADRVLVELARFADRYKGTRAAAEARQALRELKRQGGGEKRGRGVEGQG